MSLSYQDPSIPHDQAVQFLSTNDPRLIVSALISTGLNETDWSWAQNICIEHLNNSNEDIVSAAITALGHIARRHERLDLEITEKALKEAQLKHPSLAGNIADTLDDIEMFVSNN
ncbi:hypothetical protein AAFN46_05185 [Pseudomonas sp. CAU 1711]|uniref:hypothetical protein n=1 Tax=Pseudomonas sp. CAU 1711 TaxID=3140356 RepID=UPI0032613924